MAHTTENEEFLRCAAVTSVLDATLLATSSAKLGKQLHEHRAVGDIGQLSERLADFLKFVTLAHRVLAPREPQTATYLGGFQREVLGSCERMEAGLTARDLDQVAVELDWISAIFGDYPTFGAEVAIALRHQMQPAA